MSNTWGRSIRLSIFGESHGPAVGMTLAGLPPGFEIDWDQVNAEMARRAPGSSPLSTARAEADNYEALSGVFEGRTTGAPLTAIIRNRDARSGDYKPHLLRPGHADLASLYKYRGFADYRGGGHFSGRLTAPLVLAGAIAKQLLRERGIFVGARIYSVHGIKDANMPAEMMPEVSAKPFPVYDDSAGERMKAEILSAKDELDSVGGVVECAALGVPGGWGDPFFDSLESVISSMMFSIPAVKGIEFGDGFGLTAMRGSEANDPMRMENGEIRVSTNHNGGVTGGISNGQALVLRAAIKPTPTIGKEQVTVDTIKRETVTTAFGGRHDPCIVPRAVPVIEAALAICLLDVSLSNG